MRQHRCFLYAPPFFQKSAPRLRCLACRRTALTSFVGSIGIIGIALIFAVSQGTTAYIDALQEDTLSSYPLTL